ncbi:LytR/AlgR family response regulator transcription factor [Breznakiella homolactica]|uniref:Response regulator transcription factor n=1 Tax=Breznakiella homolactica TaxID=2798577 RepID=A0A7T7XMS6_9SPIR|nr:LytTR family DNA-binding domain-containing protein [Breznakiella homolactica]QQO09234.1 LytTR family DNA-binding domain-containing protein [Breznakiella homolactica]
MRRIFICDDNSDDAGRLGSILSDYYGDGETEILTYTEPQGLLDFLGKDRGQSPAHSRGFTAAFLDILMPGMNGTELAERMRSLGYTGTIVFLTNSNDYAAESYRVQAFSYLLKPADPGAVRDILLRIENNLGKEPNPEITVTIRRTAHRIHFSELLYTEIRNHTLLFFLKNGETLETFMKMKDTSPVLLADRRFAVCHNSFIINMDYVKRLEPGCVIMVNDDRIPIAKRSGAFKKQYMTYMFSKT